MTATANNSAELRPSSYVLTGLLARGMTIDEALSTQRRLALTAIGRAPRVYLMTSVARMRASIEHLGQGVAPSRYLRAPAVTREPARVGLSAGRRVTELWFLVTIHTLSAVVLLLVPGRQRVAAVSLLTVGLLILAATVLTHGGLWRYSLQAAPEAWLVSSAGVVYIAGAVIARVAADRRKPPWLDGADSRR